MTPSLLQLQTVRQLLFASKHDLEHLQAWADVDVRCTSLSISVVCMEGSQSKLVNVRRVQLSGRLHMHQT